MRAPTYITGTIQTNAYRILRGHIYEVLAQYELTPTYWSMLGIIAEAREGVRQVDIARSLHVKAPLVTIMAQQLQKKGIVQRVQNQFDARAKLLAITPTGKKFLKVVENAVHSELNNLLVGLTENDLQTYHKVLTTIVANDAVHSSTE